MFVSFWSPRRDGGEASRVRGARFELSGSCGFIYSLLCERATILLDPGGTNTGSPKRSCRCCLPLNVTRSASTYSHLRGCINLEEGANLPAARSLRCVRFIDAVPPSFHLLDFRLCVGNAVAPAIFNGLANINATLASFSWLGFVNIRTFTE